MRVVAPKERKKKIPQCMNTVDVTKIGISVFKTRGSHWTDFRKKRYWGLL